MNLSAALRLGRVSNLPTVWTNALAGFVVAGGTEPTVLAGVAAALSLFYVAGMYLNDAFDRAVDSRERPTRPIPAGQASALAVFAAGYAMLGGGLAVLGWLAARDVPAEAPWALPAAGTALAAAILLYDMHHKGNPWSPAVMALCRVLVYAIAALAVAPLLPAPVLAAAAAVFCYLVGLTQAARREASGLAAALAPLALLAAPALYGTWLAAAEPAALAPLCGFVAWTGWAAALLRRGGKDVPRGIAMLIAGLALFDATLVAAHGAPGLAVLAVLGFLLTVALQRHVPGT